MAAFEYQALDATGKTVKGITTGDHAKQVRAELRAQGLMPIDVKSISESNAKQAAGKSGKAGSKVKIKAKSSAFSICN